MSDTPKLDLDAAEKAVEIASEELGRLCKARWAGPEEWANVWHWEIPANEERDTDLKIGKAIGLCQDLIKELRRLQAPSPGSPDLTEAEMAEALRIYWLGPNVFSDNLRAAINSVLRSRAALSSSPAPQGVKPGIITAEHLTGKIRVEFYQADGGTPYVEDIAAAMRLTLDILDGGLGNGKITRGSSHDLALEDCVGFLDIAPQGGPALDLRDAIIKVIEVCDNQDRPIEVMADRILALLPAPADTPCPRCLGKDQEIYCDLCADSGRVPRAWVGPAPAVEAGGLREALEAASHELSVLHGLTATDDPDAYADAIEAGLDSNGAAKCEREASFKIDTSKTQGIIRAALAALTSPVSPAPLPRAVFVPVKGRCPDCGRAFSTMILGHWCEGCKKHFPAPSQVSSLEVAHSAIYRAYLRGWKRGRRNQDPEAQESADALIKEVAGFPSKPPSQAESEGEKGGGRG
jgi:hypothetical protein